MQKTEIKIGVVSHSYPTRKDPTRSLFVKNEAHLIAQNHDVEVYVPYVYALPFQSQYSRSSKLYEEVLKVHRPRYLSIPKRKLSSITQYSLSRSVLKSIRRQNPDIVHLHALYPTGLSANKIKKSGYPVVLTIHGGDWYYNLNNLTLMKRLVESLNHCDKIISVGKALAKNITDYAPSIKDKILHVPHGIDTEIFNPAEQESDAKHTHIWGSEKIHILSVGNLFQVKGFDILLKAFSELKPISDYHLHLVTPREDLETRQLVDKIIRNRDLSNHITFYDGKSPEELAGFFRSADLFVSPSRKEGFGLVVAEAIACGTPVLATRSGGPEEIVNDNNGRTVPTEDPRQLRIGIEHVVSEIQKFDSEEMFNYIFTNFSSKSKLKILSNLYLSLKK